MNKNDSSNYQLQGDIERKPTLTQISILFSIAVILFLYVGFRAQRYSMFPGLLITEFGLILTPSLALLYMYKYDVRQVLRLNSVGALNLILVFGIMFFALPVVGVLNVVNLFIINNVFGRIIVSSIPAANNSMELIRNILIIAGSAALCEEIMFRGVIQRGLERFGAAKAILISAFLFGLLHLDFQRFLGTFLLGGLIGFLVYRSNSIYSGMFAHFCNNGFAVILGYLSTKMQQMMKSSGVGNMEENAEKIFSNLANMPKEQLISAIVTWGILFLVCAVFLTGLIIGYIYVTSDRVHKVRREPTRFKKAGLLWLAPGLTLVSIMYFAEGLKLSNATSPLAESVMRFIGLK